MVKKTLIAAFTAFMLCACNHNNIYFSYQKIGADGWEKDSALMFAVPVNDTAAIYNIYVNIRNTSEYPYQNFWFFINKEVETRLDSQADTVSINRQTLPADTVECYLANERGKWLGRGTGAAYEMPVLIERNVKFSKTGVYHYAIFHGMRQDVLKGIYDVGLRVEQQK